MVKPRHAAERSAVRRDQSVEAIIVSKTIRILSGLVVLAAVAAPTTGADGKADDWKQLFNGADLNGWDTWLGRPHKSVEGLAKLRELEEYTQRCAAKVPDGVWEVPKLERVWIWFDGFDDFDEVKAKFEARGVRVAQ